MSTYRKTLSATSLMKDPVINEAGDDLGSLKEIMLDIETGAIAYFVLSFGGFLGLGDKFFIIPSKLLTIDQDNKKLVLSVSKEKLSDAPGIDKENWPDYEFSEEQLVGVYDYFEQTPYWHE